LSDAREEEPFRAGCPSQRIKRRNQGETLADIARTYNVSPATISRLTD
jgi:hypothetical protein